jgi:hypothetical protein
LLLTLSRLDASRFLAAAVSGIAAFAGSLVVTRR